MTDTDKLYQRSYVVTLKGIEHVLYTNVAYGLGSQETIGKSVVGPNTPGEYIFHVYVTEMPTNLLGFQRLEDAPNQYRLNFTFDTVHSLVNLLSAGIFGDLSAFTLPDTNDFTTKGKLFVSNISGVNNYKLFVEVSMNRPSFIMMDAVRQTLNSFGFNVDNIRFSTGIVDTPRYLIIDGTCTV